MIRLVRLSRRWYALELDAIVEDLPNIESFAEEGTPVLIVMDLQAAKEILGTDEEIRIIEKED